MNYSCNVHTDYIVARLHDRLKNLQVILPVESLTRLPTSDDFKTTCIGLIAVNTYNLQMILPVKRPATPLTSTAMPSQWITQLSTLMACNLLMPIYACSLMGYTQTCK